MTGGERAMSSRDWAWYAFLAYTGYLERGPGVVLAELLPLASLGGPQRQPERYLGLDELRAQPWVWPELLEAVHAYNAEAEVLLLERGIDGALSVRPLSAGEGWSPRQVYDRLRANLDGTRG